MFKSGLFGVLTHVLQSEGEKSKYSITIDGSAYAIELKVNKEMKHYFVIHLPYDISQSALVLNDTQYTLSDCHFTVYDEQGGQHGLLRPHFTGNYKNTATSTNITLRAYLGDGDEILINTLRASTTHKNKKKERVSRDVPNFFEKESDKQRFKNLIISHISSLMLYLRSKQAELTQTFEKDYQEHLKTLCHLNTEYLTTRSSSSLTQCIAHSEILVNITKSLLNFSEHSHKWGAIVKIHQQQCAYYTSEQDHPAEHTLKKLTLEEPTETDTPPISQEIITSHITPVYQTQISVIKELLVTPLCMAKAQQLASLITELDLILCGDQTLAVDQQYDLLEQLLAAKEALTIFCYKAALDEDSPIIETFAEHLLPLQPQLLTELISHDCHQTIEVLIKHNLTSIYSPTTDGRPCYAYAYEMGHINCLTLYAKLGIHPLIMMSDDFRQLFSSQGIDACQLRQALTNYDRVNTHLQQTLNPAEFSMLLDSILLHLRSTHHQLSHSKGRHRRKRQETAETQALSFLITTLEITQYVLGLLSDDHIHALTAMSHFSSLQPLIDLLPLMGHVCINLPKVSQAAHTITTLLETVKTRLYQLSPEDKNRLTELLMQSATIPPGRAAMSGMVQGMYQSLSLMAWSHHAIIEELTSTMRETRAQWHRNGMYTMEEELSMLGLSENREILSSDIEAMLVSPAQQLVDFIKQSLNIRERDIKTLTETIGALPQTSSQLFTVETAPPAVHVPAPASNLLRYSFIGEEKNGTQSDSYTSSSQLRK